MIKILKQIRAMAFSFIALFLYLFGYHQAQKNAENKQIKGNLNAAKIAKNVRGNLSKSDCAKRLHNKYKR
ncbi:MAG: hypothetical protein SO314_06480 [Alphaproteobacteria bacterium]|nr:hypothetical protein [Alphaproteobacteria bacterium]